MIKSGILIQTGMVALVLAGVMLLLRMLEEIPEMSDMHRFVCSGEGLFLMVFLGLYGFFGITYGGYLLYQTFKNN